MVSQGTSCTLMASLTNLRLMNLCPSFTRFLRVPQLCNEEPRSSASPDQPLFNPSKASPSSASTQSTDLLRHYQPPKPPHLDGAMDDDAPHRRGPPATEDDNLNSEGAYTDSAPATPPRDDSPGRPGSSQDNRHLHRRAPLDKVAPDAAADHEATLNATGDLIHSPTIHNVPAFYAHGPDCCQQSPSPTGVTAGGPFPAAQVSISGMCPRLVLGLTGLCPLQLLSPKMSSYFPVSPGVGTTSTFSVAPVPSLRYRCGILHASCCCFDCFALLSL